MATPKHQHDTWNDFKGCIKVTCSHNWSIPVATLENVNSSMMYMGDITYSWTKLCNFANVKHPTLIALTHTLPNALPSHTSSLPHSIAHTSHAHSLPNSHALHCTPPSYTHTPPHSHPPHSTPSHTHTLPHCIHFLTQALTGLLEALLDAMLAASVWK